MIWALKIRSHPYNGLTEEHISQSEQILVFSKYGIASNAK